MAQIIEKEDSTTVLSEGGSDVQTVTISRKVARQYFDIDDQSPFGDEFDAALDEAQGAVSEHGKAVLVLVIEDDKE
jgi:hypothetical protein